MKKIIYVIAAILFAVSCQEKTDKVVEQITGEWHYSSIESGVNEDVYVSFATDGSFVLYQKIGDGAYWYSEGTFTLDAETMVLTGVYTDRYPWKYSYKVTVSDKTLTLSAMELEGYSTTYTRETIPAQVRKMSLPLTKSEQTDLFL